MPNMQMVHVVKERGVSRTYINFAYALVTEHGEVHWPKTKDRREVAVDPETEEELRMQVLSDMQELADRGHPLSPGWWRQLRNEEKAQEVEYLIDNPPPRVRRRSARSPPEPRPKKIKVKKEKQLRATRETYEIEAILAEKKVSTKEKKIFLVQWSGYDPSWEGARASGDVGSAMQTWEPLYLLKDTEAMQRWQSLHP